MCVYIYMNIWCCVTLYIHIYVYVYPRATEKERGGEREIDTLRNLVKANRHQILQVRIEPS